MKKTLTKLNINVSSTKKYEKSLIFLLNSRKLKEFKTVKKIGKGSFAEVFLVKDLIKKENAVLKIYEH